MDPAIITIQRKLITSGIPAKIPLLRGKGAFTGKLIEGGILVDNLGNQPFLPWVVFQETIALLRRKGGRAQRGNAMNYRLGEAGLRLDTIEGHIAHTVYGKREASMSSAELHR